MLVKLVMPLQLLLGLGIMLSGMNDPVKLVLLVLIMMMGILLVRLVLLVLIMMMGIRLLQLVLLGMILGLLLWELRKLWE